MHEILLLSLKICVSTSSTLSTPVILNSCLLLSSAMPNTIIPPEVLAKGDCQEVCVNNLSR